MAYTFTPTVAPYGDIGGGYDGIVVNENVRGDFFGAYYDLPGNVTSNGVSLPLHVAGQTSSPLQAQFTTGTKLPDGLHEYYINSNVLTSGGVANTSATGLFYSVGDTSVRATVGGYDPNLKTIALVVSASDFTPASTAAFSAQYANPFPGATLTVTDGKGFQTTATTNGVPFTYDASTGQAKPGDLVLSSGANGAAGYTINYHFAVNPPAAGVYHFYVTGYDVAADGGVAATPTFTVPEPPPYTPAGAGVQVGPSTQYTTVVLKGINLVDPAGQTIGAYNAGTTSQPVQRTEQQQQFFNNLVNGTYTFDANAINVNYNTPPSVKAPVNVSVQQQETGLIKGTISFGNLSYIAPYDSTGGDGSTTSTFAEIVETPTAGVGGAASSAKAPAMSAPQIGAALTTVQTADADLLGAVAAIGLELDAGHLTAPDAQNALYHLVDGTTSVAELSYAFFTGKTPTAAGLDYLLNTNGTGLKSDFYVGLTTENRYINMGVNLATGVGAGAASFQAAYGALSLTDAVTKAYAAIFGVTPTADKVGAILNGAVSDGHGGVETRAQYFADITGGSAAGQKAAAIGFLLADSVKEGFGAYQQADLHFLQDLAQGTALFNTDLLAAYTQAPSLVGQPVVEPAYGR